MQGFWLGVPGILLLILRVVVVIYLYQEAKQRRLFKPWLWIVFAIFEPVLALMFFYAIVYFGRDSR